MATDARELLRFVTGLRDELARALTNGVTVAEFAELQTARTMLLYALKGGGEVPPALHRFVEMRAARQADPTLTTAALLRRYPATPRAAKGWQRLELGGVPVSRRGLVGAIR